MRWRQVDHDDKEHAALKAFNELWKSKFAHDSLLVFSTGRSHKLYEELRVRMRCAALWHGKLHAVGGPSSGLRKLGSQPSGPLLT